MFYNVHRRLMCNALRLVHISTRNRLRNDVITSNNFAPLANNNNNLLQNLRTVSSSYELFELISLKRKDFTVEHVMQALTTLFQLQKHENTAIQNKHILKNTDFENLCRNLKSASRQLTIDQLIEAIKILNFVGVPTNSEISTTLLHLVRVQINDVTLSQIIFLEFLMRKIEPSPLVEAFRIALPMLMQIQLPVKMDHENPVQLTELLLFATRNPLSEQCIMNIVSALTMHGTELTDDQARSIVWSLCDLPQFNENYTKLMQNSLDVLFDSFDELSFKTIESTLSKLVARYLVHEEHSYAFYQEEFYKRCARYVIEKDTGLTSAIYIQRKFNRISFVDIDLIEYISAKFARNPVTLSSANQTALMTFITAMSTAYFKPIAWDGLKHYVLQNPIMQSNKTDWPWLRFVLELLVLDIIDHDRLNMLCEPEFLQQQVKRGTNIDHLLVLLLHQAMEVLVLNYNGNKISRGLVEQCIHVQLQRRECPLKPAVDFAFGGSKNVYSQVATKYGHYIDHVLVFDTQGSVVPCKTTGPHTTSGLRWLEEIPVGENEKLVAIVSYPKSHFCVNVPRLKGMVELRLRTLDILGVPSVVVNQELWMQLPDREKIAYIERETKLML